MSVGND
jgi:drug/metabolite transporter (DMT)-like permease